ncbi:helix-turn-helix transcriptional regulator [Fructilactobacillus frigidiflavus]|uniref:helix-turn-helix transcriptional regulator n=1 Tax=Fructilactobacillus frigidiflavus TaxID=3242688 RepID=UPI0037565C59
MDVANQLKKLRQENGYTQVQLAEKLNVSRKTVSSWENGRNLPGIPILIDLSELYHVTIDSMVKENEHAYKIKAEKEKTTLQKLWLTPVLIVAIIIFIMSCYYVVKDDDSQFRSWLILLDILLF